MNRNYDSPLRHRTRPVSEVFIQSPFQTPSEEQQIDAAADKWLADLQLYQQTLEQMAEASLDKNFKDELSAIEQWFEVLSVAERTAALYALLQQSTPVQIRFFITVLQKIGSRDPLTSTLSPTERTFPHSSLFPPPSSQQQQQQQHQYYDPYMSNASSTLGGGGNSAYRNPTKDDGFSNNASSNPGPAVSPYLAPRYNAQWGGGHDIARPKSATSHIQLQQQPNTSSSASRRHMKSQSVLLEDFHYEQYLDQPQQAPSTGASNSNHSRATSTGFNWSNPSPATVYKTTSHESTTPSMRTMQSLGSGSGTNAPAYQPSTAVNSLERDMSNLTFSSPSNDQRKPVPNTVLRNSNANTMSPASSPSTWHSGTSRSAGSLTTTDAHNIENASPKKEIVIDKRLLNDIGLWLRTLRLHKYTDNLKDLPWQKLIELNDSDLEQRGINALGARRKMLKVFEQVKNAVAQGDLDLR